jgi:hypothetical protein
MTIYLTTFLISSVTFVRLYHEKDPEDFVYFDWIATAVLYMTTFYCQYAGKRELDKLDLIKEYEKDALSFEEVLKGE